MGVLVRMISVVVPISQVDSCFELNGFAGYWEKFGQSDFKWHDEHLLVSAHPDPEFVAMEIEYWERRGLVSVESKTWKDMCVVDQTGGPTLPCDWLEWDRQHSCVWLKSTDRGEIVGPADSSIAAKAVHIPAKALEQVDVKLANSRPWWKFWGRSVR